MLAVCSTSSDERNKSTYDNDGIFNPAAIVTAASSSSCIPYSNHHLQKSSAPFVYGHTPTPSYAFGFGFYEEMSPFTGKYFEKTKLKFDHII
jgi:hypothetical protein